MTNEATSTHTGADAGETREFFAYDPDDGITFCKTVELARKSAVDSVERSQESAANGGGFGEVDEICYGRILGASGLKWRKDREDCVFDENGVDEDGNQWDSDWVYMAEYELQDFARPTPVPETGEVDGMVERAKELARCPNEPFDPDEVFSITGRQLQKSLADFATAETSRLHQAIAEADKWRLAVEALTPQGSEYHNDLPRCLAHINQKLGDGQTAKKELVKVRRELALAEERVKEVMFTTDEVSAMLTMFDRWQLQEGTVAKSAFDKCVLLARHLVGVEE